MSKEVRSPAERHVGSESEAGPGRDGRPTVRVMVPDELPVLTPEVSRILLKILMELAQDKQRQSTERRDDEQVL